MSVNFAEDDGLSPISENKAETARKQYKENSARKSWSLMDRRPDQEVLQEMGVSLLDPEDNEANDVDASVALKQSIKRKHDLENINPNSHLSPKKVKYSPRSPRLKIGSPGAGTSRTKSPRSIEKCKPLQPTENLLETTLPDTYLIEEETPLGQSITGTFTHNTAALIKNGTAKNDSYTTLGIEEELILNRRLKCEPDGVDSFSVLSDEMILSIFRWLPKRTLAHCMLVCKRWYQVACDETLWQRLDLGNKTISKDALGRILDRKPIIVRLASSEIGEWHPTSDVVQSRIQFLDLSMCNIDAATLCSLLRRCVALRKLSLESVNLDDDACELIGKCGNLETLNLTMAQGLTAEGIRFILTGCTGLQSLNISWCGLNEEALEVLVKNLPTKLQRLNLAGSRALPDELVSLAAAGCPALLELDVSDCARVSAAALPALRRLPRLEHLALSRCYLVPPAALISLGSMPSLQYLEVWGMLQAASLAALRAQLPAIHLNHFMFSAIARPTVGTRRTSIWGLRTRD